MSDTLQYTKELPIIGVSMEDCYRHAQNIVATMRMKRDDIDFTRIIALTRGGLFFAGWLSYALNIKEIVAVDPTKPAVLTHFLDWTKSYPLIVDDIVDTGDTMSFMRRYLRVAGVSKLRTASLALRSTSRFVPDYYAFLIEDAKSYVRFEWESNLLGDNQITS